LPAKERRASKKLFESSGETSVARRSARTVSARSSAHGLRRAKVDDRQVPSASVMLDVKYEPNARLALHRHTEVQHKASGAANVNATKRDELR
jgi:hypothetical protein